MTEDAIVQDGGNLAVSFFVKSEISVSAIKEKFNFSICKHLIINDTFYKSLPNGLLNFFTLVFL